MVSQTQIQLIFFLISLIAFTACKNDLKNSKRVEQDAIDINKKYSYNINMYISQNAILKAKMKAPTLVQINEKNTLKNIMPQGIEIFLISDQGKQIGYLQGDSAIMRGEKNDGFEIYKNAYAKNQKGEEFFSDELIWDTNVNKFFSSKLVKIKLKDGTRLFGYGFWGNQDFSYYEIKQSTGTFEIQ